MKLSEKLTKLRKSSGMSQEELAERLNVSRQSISRWEMGSAMPDATNLLLLSQVFHVSADYLLHDDAAEHTSNPIPQETKGNPDQILFFLVVLEVMALCLQFLTVVILESVVFGVLSFLPFAVMLGGFEYAYRKKGNEESARFRVRFYQISIWLGAYFPIRLFMTVLLAIFPDLFTGIIFEVVTIVLYLMCASLLSLTFLKNKK